jgi:hypothetical protein
MTSVKNKIVSVVAAIAVLSMTSGLPQVLAAPKTNSISLIPTITSVSVVNGVNGPVLMATGTVSAVVDGVQAVAPFSAPVDITLAPNQPAAATCPVLDLMLGPIHLNLLGLDVTTSQICLTITATQGGGLLGDLLCSLANLLNQNQQLTAAQALTPGAIGALPAAQIGPLLTGLTRLLNQAVANLKKAVLTAINQPNPLADPPTCQILHLELGPLNLTLLGLNVMLDNCHGHAITVDITGITSGPGSGLLGQLLCGLLGGGGINLGATLQQILNALLNLLNGL